jgi:hypothetical protein
MGSEPVSALSCCRIWTVRMIIIPFLPWRTFRYCRAVRDTDVRDIGSSPLGDGTIPILTLIQNNNTNAARLKASFQSSARKHPQCEPQAKMMNALCIHTYTNARKQNKNKKSGVGHQIFRISDYKHDWVKFSGKIKKGVLSSQMITSHDNTRW